MKVLILAGGYGTRISEESGVRPKPIVDIGEKPIIWHIMKIYSHYGFNDFVILLGYKGHMIKEYFLNYARMNSHLELDFREQTIKSFGPKVDPWKVTLLDTGEGTLTGGRILRAKEIVGNERFMLTYGDGVANINIPELIKNHTNSKQLVTMSAVRPKARFGVVEMDHNNKLVGFSEKPEGDNGWINGGFFVCEPQAFDYIQNGDMTTWEKDPMEKLAHNKQLNCYIHEGFWKCMDTLSDKNALNDLWNAKKAEWKIWD